MRNMIDKIIERFSATWLRLLCVRAFKNFLALWRKSKPYKPHSFQELPAGVSRSFYNAIDKIALPNTQKIQREGFMSLAPPTLNYGFQLMVNDKFPMTMSDGTIVHGCMIGSDGKPVWIVDRKQGAPQSDSKNESHGT